MTTAGFTLGTKVQIISTGQSGVVIKTADKKNRVRVAVGTIEILVQANNLKAKAQPSKKQSTTPPPRRRETGPLAITIDLHGKTIAEATEIVEATIDRAVMQSTREIEIVHGLGTGKLRDAIHKYLNKHSDLVAFAPHVSNPGSTMVRIRHNS